MAADILGQVLPSGLFNSPGYQTVAAIGGLVFQWLIWMFIILGPAVIWYIYIFWFRYRAVFFERTEGHPLSFDRARIKNFKDGSQKLVFFWNKKLSSNPVDIKYERRTRRGARVLFFEKISNTEIVPIKVEVGNPSIQMTPIREDLKLMYILNKKRIDANYGDTGFWNKYGNTVLSLGALVIFAFVMWMILSKTEVMIKVADAAISRGADIIENAKTATQVVR